MKKYIYVFLFALIVFGAGIVLGNITYRDKDASPVADRKLRNEDGLIRAMDTSNVEGRYFSKLSLEQITDAEVAASGITTRSKLPADVAYEDEANVFTAAQTFSAGTGALPSINFSGQTTDGLFSKSATQVGFAVDGVERGFVDNNGDWSIPGVYISTKSCAAGFTRVNGLCIDTDSSLTQLVSYGTLSTLADTNVNNSNLDNAKYAILRVHCFISQDGTAETASFDLFVRKTASGDQSSVDAEKVCGASADLANETSSIHTEFIMLLDGSGDFEYEVVYTGTVTTAHVHIYLAGYYE